MNKKPNGLGFKRDHEIPFQWILYSKSFWESFPDNHSLSRKPTGKGCALSNIIKDVCDMQTGCAFPKIDYDYIKKQEQLVHLFQKLLMKWRKTGVKYILEKHCDLTALEKNKTNRRTVRRTGNTNHIMRYERFSADKGSYEVDLLEKVLLVAPVCNDSDDYEPSLIRTELPKNTELKSHNCDVFDYALGWTQVYSFLLSIVNHVIPLEIFGSPHNRKCFKKAMKTFLMLGKHDKFYLDNLMRNAKISHCKWANTLPSVAWRSKIVAMVWLWLFSRFIMQILLSYFYITESNHRRYQLFYFRKKHWQSLYDSAYQNLIRNGKLRDITHGEALEMAKVKFSCGSSVISKPAAIRFMPKAHGLRPILPVRSGNLKKTKVLKAKLLVQHLTAKVFAGFPSVRSLGTFQSVWLNCSKTLESYDHSVYAVRVDIEDAFGSIQHKKLIELLNEASGKIAKVLYYAKFKCIDKFRLKSKPPLKFLEVDSDGHQIGSEYRNCTMVRIDSVVCINVKETIGDIEKLIAAQVVKSGRYTRLLITNGIAQGGTLSSSLCELHYSAMCCKHLLQFHGNNSFLLRSVDDFLLITSVKENAIQFLNYMEEGIEDFNCHINKAKTLHNIDGSNIRLQFRGIVFCTASKQLLISVDALATCLPRYSIRLNSYKNPGHFIMLRLQQITKARLQTLMIHPSYTSVKALLANVWRCSVMVGGRLVSLIKVVLLPRQEINSSFIVKSLVEIGGKVWAKVKGLWSRSDQTPAFRKSLIVLVFLCGILEMCGQPHHPPLTKLRKALRGKIKVKSKYLTSSQTDLLPDRIKCKL